jgi:hypothetical protein
MIKHIIVLLVLTVGILLGMPYCQQALALLIQGHDFVSQALTAVFSMGKIGNLLRGLLAFVSIPLAIGFIPSFLFWLVKRHWFPYFMSIVWVIWLIQAGALITGHQPTSSNHYAQVDNSMAVDEQEAAITQTIE